MALFPLEVVNEFLKFVDLNLFELLQCSRVSSVWRELVLHKVAWRNRMLILEEPENNDLEINEIFEIFRNVLVHLELRRVDLTEEQRVLSRSQFCKLASLSLKNCVFDWNQIILNLTSMTHLESLCIDADQLFDPDVKCLNR